MNRILIADDEGYIATLIAELLRELPYEIEMVHNGRDAIKSVREHKPDLVISDLMMPYASGMDVLRAMRDSPPTRSTPMILMSAAPLPEVPDSNVQVVKKPFNLDLLLATVLDAVAA